MFPRVPPDVRGVRGQRAAVHRGVRDDRVLALRGGGVGEHGGAAGVCPHHLDSRIGAAHLEEDRRPRHRGNVVQRRGEALGGSLRRVGRQLGRRQAERRAGIGRREAAAAGRVRHLVDGGVAGRVETSVRPDRADTEVVRQHGRRERRGADVHQRQRAVRDDEEGLGLPVGQRLADGDPERRRDAGQRHHGGRTRLVGSADADHGRLRVQVVPVTAYSVPFGANARPPLGVVGSVA